MIRPEIGLSDIYLDLCVETGTSFDGSFTVYSKNGQELEGKVFSTNDKIVPRVTELSGTECQIPFYFKGRMAIPGEEHYGEFLLLTNGGEYNIPFCVTVVRQKVWFGDQSVSDLTEFAEFAKKDWKKAKDIFFTKDFPDILLAEQEEFRSLYHDLLKGFSKDAILDHFLMVTAAKQPVQISADFAEVPIDDTRIGKITLTKEGWGWLEGHIYGENGNLYVSRERITMEDFEDEKLELFLSFKENQEEDTVVIETAFSRITIPVYKKYAVIEGNRPPKRHNPDCSRLLRYFVQFRTGKITTEEYIGYSMQNLPSSGKIYELYCFLLLIIREKTMETENEDCNEYGKKIEAKEEEYLKDPEVRNFYRYVLSLWKKDPAITKEAARNMKIAFEKERKLRDFLLLLVMDEEIAFHYEAQWAVLLQFIEQNENSPLLYLAVLDVLNKEPYLLEQLKERKTSVIRWGLRHQYLSQKLIEQFARLAIKERSYKKNQLPILMSIYEKKPDELYLKAICTMLMKGNKIEKEYHIYFEQAVRRKLNLIGLNEFFLRSLDFETNPVLPKLILYYFHYSNSLDKREKAWLYLNILIHKEEYEEVYDSYYERIEDFVKEQLMEGKMNRYLKQLYEKILPELLKDLDLAKYVPNLIFRKKLTCSNLMMEGVCVCHPENEEEISIPFVDGCCQIEIYSPNAKLYFVDRMGNRYVKGIAYNLESYLEEESFRDFCLEYNKDNRKVFVKWMNQEEDDKKEQLARLLIQNDEAKSWKTEKAVEKILDYHYEEKTLEDLSECLDKINYRIISPSYRRTLMNYYMACNRMEDAYFGVELYGSDFMEPAQLYLLTSVGLYLHKNEKDDLLLVMAHRSFVNRKYNNDILIYLRTYFEGRVFDLLDLWTVLKKEGLETAEFEERVLNQISFVKAKNEKMLDVLLSYLDKTENAPLIESMLEAYNTYYLCRGLKEDTSAGKLMPESYFSILDKQAKGTYVFNQISSLAYLLHKSESGWEENEKMVIRRMVQKLCKEEVIFPFFKKFESFVSIPFLWRESVCFWFFTENEKEYSLSIELGDGEEKHIDHLIMKKIGTGFYYGSCYVPAFEQILQADAEGFEGRISWKRIEEFVPGSRNHLLFKMQEEKKRAGTWMADYERIMERMKEQLKFLGEQ